MTSSIMNIKFAEILILRLKQTNSLTIYKTMGRKKNKNTSYNQEKGADEGNNSNLLEEE